MKNKIDKQALREKIQSLEGLSNDDKSQLLALLAEQKKYGLVWEDSTEEAEEVLRDNIPVLREVTERRILSKGSFMGQESEEESPNHILIEGDNLHALTALTYTHEGKVDVIYIDPPYNTGNKDFVYNDSFVDSEDGYRHSKWLSFMEKRLRIAKKLLSDKGVIFISIDDNEQANLKLLCDEVFGEGNFVTKFDWRKKTGANDAKDIAVVTESIILYTKNRQITLDAKIWNRDEESINQDRYKFSDEYVDSRGKFYYDTLDRGGLQYSDSMNYGIEAPDGVMIYPNGRNTFVNDGWIWKWGKDKVKWGLENHFLEFVKSKKSQHSQYTIKYKVYQNVDNECRPREKAGRAYMNLITEPINQQGNAEMTSIFNGKTPFSNPKPLGLICYLMKIINPNSIIILDFFAGSGTTLHATMQLNSEDGGHRQCILVTNNENNICEEVTYERNKRVINGYTTPKGVEVPGLTANNLRYYQMDFIPREQSTANKHALMNAATDLLCIKEDLYEEVKPFVGLNFKSSVLRYFKNAEKQMLVVFNERAIEHIVPKICEVATKDNPLKIYVFCDGAYAYDDEFHEVKDLVQLCALPDAIYQAYMRVLPPRRYSEETLAEGEDAAEALNDEYEYNVKEGGMA